MGTPKDTVIREVHPGTSGVNFNPSQQDLSPGWLDRGIPRTPRLKCSFRVSDVVVGDKRSRDEAAHNVYSAELSALSLDPSAPPETQYPQEATASHGARSRPGPQRPARDAVPAASPGAPTHPTAEELGPTEEGLPAGH